MRGSAVGCSPRYLEITEIKPWRKLENPEAGNAVKEAVDPNHHKMILPLFCVWLCCFQGVSPLLRTWPRNRPTEEVGPRHALGLELGYNRQGQSVLT